MVVKEVFGQYLFASAFFWEDIVSFFVIAIHTAYLLALILNLLSAEQLMWLALVAYSAYFINALQFLISLVSTSVDEINQNNHFD